MPAKLRIYYKEFKYEVLKLIRTPVYAISTLLFPVMFYVLFGIIMNRNDGAMHRLVAKLLLVTFGCYGVIGAALYGFGVSLAMERGLGWLDVKRSTPMPPGAYFAAKLGMSLLFSAMVVVALLAVGILFGGADLSPMECVQVFASLVIGAIPFCAFGLAIGYVVRPTAAVAIVNLIYLPMSFLSGLWIPVEFLPPTVQKLAVFLPPNHFAELVRSQVNAESTNHGSPLVHLGVLAGFTLVCVLFAKVAARRELSFNT